MIRWEEFEPLKNRKDGFDIFTKMVKKDLEIEDNPKADKLLWIAWERGHSCGYNEVYINALELVELIK